jgi:hydrogenase/urease accessory protein HupE
VISPSHRAARRAARPAVTLAAIVLLGAIVAPPVARAHNQPYSFVDLRLDGAQLAGSVSAHVVDVGHEIGVPPESLLAAVTPVNAAAMERLFDQRLEIAPGGGEPLHLRWTGARTDPERRLVVFSWDAELAGAPGEIRVSAALFPYDPQHQTYLNVYEGGTLRDQEILDGSRATTRYFTGGAQGALAVLRRFVPAGIHHIFIGPDHILFIVGLLLLGGSLGRLLKIITAFTVAHSITLALATFHVVNPPSRLIEPLIAASIVLVGVENLFAMKRPRDRRALIAFLFGFVHGFGFASVLRDFGLPSGALGWSLLGFNAGVEVGQGTIVLLVAPALALIRARRPEVDHHILGYGSISVIVAGGYWLVERTFFS